MINLITFEEVEKYSDKYPVKALVFHAGTGCGKEIKNIAAMLEPLSENPCLHVPIPIGTNAIVKVCEIYKDWYNKCHGKAI